MRSVLLAVVLLLGADLAFAGVSNLWPLPNAVQHANNDKQCYLMTQSSFEILPQGHAVHSPVIQAAVQRFHGEFLFPAGVPRVPGVAYSDCSIAGISDHEHKLLKSIRLHVEDISGDLRVGISEWYNLSIQHGSGAVLHSKTVFGALRGLETFAQLIDFAHYDERKDQTVFALSQLPIFIEDAPSYPFRGFLIDTARHYLPVSLILHHLDAMAMNKFNVLHWHMTDSQSFPFSGKIYPELAHKGAFHPGLVYTYDDVKTVVREAYLRGIIVMPEFDTPGHAESWGKAIPELISNCQATRKPMDPSKPTTYNLLSELYQEVASLFPSELMHVGGDEVPMECWNEDSRITQFMSMKGFGSRKQVAQHFVNFLLETVGIKLNKRILVWQEVFEDGLSVPPNTIIDMWKFWGDWRQQIKSATDQKLNVVVSSGWYLDWNNAGLDHFYKSYHKDFGGNAENQKYILGGKACMWGEKIDASIFQTTVWPRASCTAEKLWTVENYNLDQVKNRLIEFRCRMIARGVAVPTMDENGGHCLIELGITPNRQGK